MFLFFDTETISVNTTPRIIQMGWVLTNGSGVGFRSQCFIVRPDDFVVPSWATRTRRITTAAARRNGMKISAVLDAFSKDVATAEVLIAHNAQFDKDVICDELLRAGRGDIFAGKVFYCTMRSSTYFCKIKKRRGYKWPTLEELHFSLFGNTYNNVHNALSDARACANCFFELRRRGAVFDPQSSDDERRSDAYDNLALEDQDLIDEIETLNEFLRRSEKNGWACSKPILGKLIDFRKNKEPFYVGYVVRPRAGSKQRRPYSELLKRPASVTFWQNARKKGASIWVHKASTQTLHLRGKTFVKSMASKLKREFCHFENLASDIGPARSRSAPMLGGEILTRYPLSRWTTLLCRNFGYF